MLRVLLSILALGALVACRTESSPGSVGSEVESAPRGVSGYQPFPSGYGYMLDTAALQAAVASGDRGYVRRHGWMLWAGIMQQGQGIDWPVWSTWPNSTAAFAGGPPPPIGCDEMPGPGSAQTTAMSVRQHNRSNIVKDDLKTPIYELPQVVRDEFPSAIFESRGQCTIRDGKTFQNNGDIMIVTESLSLEGYEWIRGAGGKPKLYEQATLDELNEKGVHQLEAPQRHIVTKHMYWPVLEGELGVLPVWNDDFGPEYEGYAGYERWKTLVAVDPSGSRPGMTAAVAYLWGIDYSDMPVEQRSTSPVSGSAKVVGIEQFYHHKVTQADWDSFDTADKAILNASSQWAYRKPFGPGDYLVTIAMHINTKEIPSWGLQSVYWSDRPNQGEHAQDRPSIPQAEGPWAHYKLVDAYAIPDVPGGTQLPVAMNPYIELVIHPVATNCQNCHTRAGWATAKSPNQASYQDSGCMDLLEMLSPQAECLQGITLTDMQWIIADRAVQ